MVTCPSRALPVWLLVLVGMGAGGGTAAGEWFPLVGSPADAVAWVPDSGDHDATWNTFDGPSNLGDWTAGMTGVGYEDGSGYEGLILLDVLDAMMGVRESCYVRIEFEVAGAGALEAIEGLRLSMQYDDGFAAYLNGSLLRSVNAPAGALTWESGASGGHEADGSSFETWDVSGSIPALRVGRNVLAVHGLNDGPGSSDFLVRPELEWSNVAPPPTPEVSFPSWVGGLSRPVALANAGDGSGRLFVAEQRGTVRVIDTATGDLASGSFLDIRTLVRDNDEGGNEQGLLGIVFPPGFGGEGKNHFYVNYTTQRTGSVQGFSLTQGATVVSRIQVGDDGSGDPGSEEILLVVSQPNSNHNGGDMHFGPDGFLYLALGDGGSGNDPQEKAQNLDLLLGKMLRIDVEGPPDPGLAYAIPPSNPFASDAMARDEIWAYGLRNPWRWCFDSLTGDLYIADVGQGRFEEINFVAAGSTGGENYGWDFYEAEERRTDANSDTPPPFEETVGPVFFYGRGLGISVTGGCVYRGSAFPRMVGKYFFGDFGSGRVWAIERQPDGTWVDWLFGQSGLGVAAFGEDEQGELYVADLGGAVHRVEDSRDSAYLDVVESGVDPATGQFRFVWGAETGESYQVQRSGGLDVWEDVADPVTATAGDSRRLEFTETPEDAAVPGPKFYRVGALAP